MPHNNLSVIILAAGAGTRMKSPQPKPLQEFAGSTILEHILESINKLQPKQIIIVYSGDLKLFTDIIKQDNVVWVKQEQQLGTGNAVQTALPQVTGSETIILCGDTPLVKASTLANLIDKSGKSLGLITAKLDNPFGFGRIVRNQESNLIKIVEEKDANEPEKEIKEISSGIIFSPTEFLKFSLARIDNNNAQGEYYLPSIIPIWLESGKVTTVLADQAVTVRGINTFSELAELEAAYSYEVAKNLMSNGVRMTNPHSFICLGEITAKPGVKIANNVTIRGKVTLEPGCIIESNCILEDVVIGENAIVKANSIVLKSEVASDATIGPFAYVRPNCSIGNQAKIGAFVEAKNTSIGIGSKANHLSYLGDTNIGSNVNIGAGTITCNYDGKNKFETNICDNAFIGSGSQLIAPLTIGINSYIGAGSCITDDTNSDSLTIARARQTTIPNWKKEQKVSDK